MVKIGIFADVHNNLPALEAVLSKLAERGCSQYICCGDIIGIGPFPDATVKRLMTIPNLIAVAGNHDRYLTEGLPAAFPNAEHMEYEEMLHHRWEHSLLSGESIAFLKSLPLQTETIICGHHIRAAHYPMDDNGRYLPISAENVSENGEIFLCGHDHSRSIACHDEHWIVNPGSLGCPGRDKNIARAAIAVISETGISVEPLDVPYDVSAAVNEIDRLNYPSAGDIKRFFYGID